MRASTNDLQQESFAESYRGLVGDRRRGRVIFGVWVFCEDLEEIEIFWSDSTSFDAVTRSKAKATDIDVNQGAAPKVNPTRILSFFSEALRVTIPFRHVSLHGYAGNDH
ncbi:hypothetical protein RHGRI_030783 [Rhododendron griersonianum]|uniref:PiggyBac transposable element-derived protein domain-containing protein n=1 Tax=Rhododendron griersonianum TaxID=479676 RepID=A0AAV6I5F0_9ERIC|nr:hypothetical protein RHGRI_030783 [Rhododendron griersonianum]